MGALARYRIDSKRRRILFLISDTGGGHRSAAQALAEAIHFLHPQRYEVIIEDIWKHHTPHPIRQLPNAYRWLVGPGLPLWRLMWRMVAHPIPQHHMLDHIRLIVRSRVSSFFRTVQPDLVVSVHPLLNRIGFDCLRGAGLFVPFVTVVTDLCTLHPTWVDPRVTRCIVPTECARACAIRFGMALRKIEVYGQPVSIKFAHLREGWLGDKLARRQQLGLEIRRPTVLLTSGGEGDDRLLAVARQIAQRVPRVQLLIVTGRNRILYRELEAMTWAVPVRIYGFVENMHELMHAADLIVTRAGPSTISEALVAGLPIILSGFIPGQETGNVSFVERHGAGVFARSPAHIAHVVDQWTRPDSGVLVRFAMNATNLARPRASLLIAEDLCHLLEQHKAGYSVVSSVKSRNAPDVCQRV